jgi:hypothetical protein
VNFWCRPFASCADYAREACRAGLDSGDFLYAAYGAGTQPWAAMLATQDLAQFEAEHEPNIALIDRLKNRGFADSVRLLVQWSRALQGRTAAPLSLSGAGFDEQAYRAAYAGSPFFAAIHAIVRLQLCVLLGSPAQALAAADDAGALVQHLPGTVWPLSFELWSALALAANAGTAAADGLNRVPAPLRDARARFDALRPHCAENYQAPALLLEAEIARLEGRMPQAVALFEQAIEFTAAQPQPMWLALAHELCARCLLDAGRVALVRMHLAQALVAYARWGAMAKVEAMAQQYPLLGAGEAAAAAGGVEAIETVKIEPAAVPGGAARPADSFDWFSVSKAAQAIAAEVEIDSLLASLMRIAIENAGAERGALVLEGDGPALVHALDGIDTGSVRAPVPLEQSTDVPVGIVNYVRRTAQTVRRSADGDDGPHAADPYLVRHRVRSWVWWACSTWRTGTHKAFSRPRVHACCRSCWRRRRFRWTTPGCSRSKSARSPNASMPRPG